MLYTNRMYPHPVLGIGDDVEGIFEVDLTVSSTVKEIEMALSFSLQNKDLEKLLQNGSIQLMSQVYCRRTMFRQMFPGKQTFDLIRIPSQCLNGEVEMDFFICAIQPISDYYNEAFNEDYQGYSFTIDKGDLLAYGGKARFHAKKEPGELRKVSSLMNISSSGEKETTSFRLDYADDKITILLCEPDYLNYAQVCKFSPQWHELLVSSIVLPALMEAVRFTGTDESEEFCEQQWYRTIQEVKSEHEGQSPLFIAQHILQQPVNRAFSSLTELIEAE